MQQKNPANCKRGTWGHPPGTKPVGGWWGRQLSSKHLLVEAWPLELSQAQ